MASRPGTSPTSDIVDYNLDLFGGEIDELIREAALRPDFFSLREPVDNLLWQHLPSWTKRPADYAAIRKSLLGLLAELDSPARP